MSQLNDSQQRPPGLGAAALALLPSPQRHNQGA
jgi:hypothetical protein